MSLVSCPECSREVSDKAGRCIHCGFPLEVLYQEARNGEQVTAKKIQKTKVESIVRKCVDFIFGIFYVYLIYILFFTNEITPDELSDDGEAIGFYVGIAIAFAILYFIHKLIRAVLGTIGGMFDSTSE